MTGVANLDRFSGRLSAAAGAATSRPEGLSGAPVSYGPEVRALALYFLVRQHLPVERTQEAIAELCGVGVSMGWLHAPLALGADAVAEPVAEIEQRIAGAKVVGFDETPLKVGPKGEKLYVLRPPCCCSPCSCWAAGTRPASGSSCSAGCSGMLGVVAHGRYALLRRRGVHRLLAPVVRLALRRCAGYADLGVGVPGGGLMGLTASTTCAGKHLREPDSRELRRRGG